MGLNLKGPYISLEKEKENLCVAFTYPIKKAREIRKFHATVMQRWLKNVQKKHDECDAVVFFLVTQQQQQ